MKKFFSLFAAVLFAGSMMAEVVTLTMADFAATEFKDDASGISVVTAKNSGSTQPAYNATGKDLRIYAKGDITISAARPITAISFEISAQGKKRLAELTADGGTVTVKGDPDFTASWSGNAASVKLTVGEKAVYGTESDKAGQLCFTAMNVTLGGEAPAVYAPKIEAPLEVFYKELEVTITCATEGASIYYTLDGTDPSYTGALLYNGPFKITETTTVRAVAEKGTDDYSAKVEKTFTKGEVWSVSRAISELDMTTPLANKIVKGKICQKDEWNEEGGWITYWIEDLETPDVKMEVYKGFGVDGDEFVTENALQVGYIVTVLGNLKIYKPKTGDPIYEFDAGSIIVDLDENPQGITNTSVETKAVKTIQNGVLVIEKNGAKYNAFGQNVR